MVVEEKFVAHLLEQAFNTVGTTVGVDLREYFPADQSDGVNELEIAVLVCYSLNVVLIFFGKGNCIFFLLDLALLGENIFLFVQLAFTMR